MQFSSENQFFNASDDFDLNTIKELLLEMNPTLDLEVSPETHTEEVAILIDPSKPLKREPKKIFQLSLFS